MSINSPISSLSISWNSSYWIRWHQKNWTIVFIFSVFYLLSVRLGVAYMDKRRAFDLRKYLGPWSMGLALFSILGSWITGSELLTVLSQEGFHSSICDNSYFNDKQVLFWTWLWTWSKIIEFGDTMFLVLHKKPLSFLHVYHHAVTAPYAFFMWHSGPSCYRWSVLMNYIVHSFMYTYYALAAYGVRPSKPVSIFITLSQILQMILGCIYAAYLFYYRISGSPCKSSLAHDIVFAYIYIVFAILFIHMFYTKYLKTSKSLKSN